MMDVEGGDAILFEEEQGFRQPWLVALVAGIAVLIWWGTVQQIVLGIPFGTNPAPDPMMLVFAVCFVIGLPLLFPVMRLETRVLPGELQFRFFPLHLRYRHVPREEIARAEAITYHPLRDYWGWGIRWAPHGIAYAVAGNRALLVTLQSAKTFLLGSRRPGLRAHTPATRRERRRLRHRCGIGFLVRGPARAVPPSAIRPGRRPDRDPRGGQKCTMVAPGAIKKRRPGEGAGLPPCTST